MADRQYELVYILPPDTTEQQVTDLHGQVEAVVSRLNGKIEKTDNWGRKRLAYEIGHNKEGVYVLDVINGTGELMKELDRRLKVMEAEGVRFRTRANIGTTVPDGSAAARCRAASTRDCTGSGIVSAGNADRSARVVRNCASRPPHSAQCSRCARAARSSTCARNGRRGAS